MRQLLFLGVAAATLGVSMSCTSRHLPASPVPAPLTDMQAMRMGRAYIQDHGQVPAGLVGIQRSKWGYLLLYNSAFDPAATPPKQSHLLAVHNDGLVKEYVFEGGR